MAFIAGMPGLATKPQADLEHCFKVKYRKVSAETSRGPVRYTK
jgi:hypothetical protein